MVASARLVAGLPGLRNRNTRVTNKTQLRVVRGSIDADPIIPEDEDDEKNRILASQGVDEEDANEHHLQAALFASTQKTLSTSHFKTFNADNDPNAYIPTPDAAGLVSEYDTLYPPSRFKDPVTHIRFSDSIDESCIGGLSGSFTYFLDDRDAEWLGRNNGAARGEGTSASASAAFNVTNESSGLNGSNGMFRGASRTTHSRGAKAKGKEPERPPLVIQQPNMVINEDLFELVMGLFEKWTDETVCPYLHLHYNPEHFPAFAEYEQLLSVPLPSAAFANFMEPPNMPSPDQMVQFGKLIYPWWKERRMERMGQPIVPRLNILVLEAQEKEDKTGSSPYICFRKRDVKPIRKTRTNNVTHIEKLTRLKGELLTSLELAKMVLQRENLKSDSATASEQVWRKRGYMSENMKVLNNLAPGSVPTGDESFLFDKEPKPRKKVDTTAAGRIILTNRRLSQARPGLSESLDPHSPLSLNGDTSHLFELCQKASTERYTAIKREVERDLIKSRKDDMYWDDVVDMPFQSTPPSNAEKLFKPVSASSNVSHPSLFSSASDTTRSSTRRLARSARLRVGRGGRMHLDRRLYPPQPQRLLHRESAGHPRHVEDRSEVQDYAERWASRGWRPHNEASEEARPVKKRRPIGEDYWSHTSVYDPQREESLVSGQTPVQPPKELHDLVFDSESSKLGHGGHGSYRTWTWGGEEGSKRTPLTGMDLDPLGVELVTRGGMNKGNAEDPWRCKNAVGVTAGGGALALFVDGDAMDVDEVQYEGLRDHGVDEDRARAGDIGAEVADRAWRIEERWRYDADCGHGSEEGEERFLLDDFQPKFMRTIVTLLDARDNEALLVDPQLLAPPPLKQDRYLDHQLRLQNSMLPFQLSSSNSGATTTPFQSTSTVASPLPLQKVNGVHPLSALPSTQNHVPNMNGIGGSPTPPMPLAKPVNGANTLGLTPSGVRLPPDSSASSVRVSASVRAKQSSLGIVHPHVGGQSPLTSNLANGTTGDTLSRVGQTTPSYPPLKAAFGRVLVGQQDPQQQGRVFQKPVSGGVNLVNPADPTSMGNLSTGMNNVHVNRTQLRTRANGDTPSTSTSTSSESSNADHYTLPQQVALPRLPATGPRRV